jgi:hypothetical protein
MQKSPRERSDGGGEVIGWGVWGTRRERREPENGRLKR